MANLITNKILNKAVSYTFFLVVLVVFLAMVYTGFITWEQGYANNPFSLKAIAAGAYLMVFAPGITILIIAFYFFIHLSGWVETTYGVLASVVATVIHVYISIPSLHAGEYFAFLSGLIELLITVAILYLLSKRYKNNRRFTYS